MNLNLELTDLCNVKCRFCGQAETPKVHGFQANKFMKWEVWKASIDGLADFEDEVDLCPHWLGEPMLHPEFSRFVRYAFENNAGNRLFRHFKLHTNGTLLDAERIDTILDCANMSDQAEDTFGFVHFSVDAYTPGVYLTLKKVDVGAKVYANIQALLERREQRGLKWPRVTNAFIVTPENRHEARWFLDFWTRVFDRLDLDFDVLYDWPLRFKDNLYFRRLHQKEQATADRLHRVVLDEHGVLGLTEAGAFIEDAF